MSTVMTKLATALRWVLMSFLVFATMPSSSSMLAQDLSKYRDFKFGMDLATVAKQAGTNPSQANVLHSRPALIQDLKWRPQPLGYSVKTEPVQEIVFGFYDGELFRIEVIYDQHETEGLTTSDLVEAISTSYGASTSPVAVAKSAGQFGDQDQVVARWQDSAYRFDLIRASYGPGFTLVGVVKKLETESQAALIEAARLDDKEAPQKEADRIASEGETQRAKLEQARLVNKPKFRP